MSEEARLSGGAEPPNPMLNGREHPKIRRFREKLAAGAIVPAAPEGEQAVSFALEPDDIRAFQSYAMKDQFVWILYFAVFFIGFNILLSTLSPTRSRTPPPPPHPQSGTEVFLNLFLALLLPLGVLIAAVAMFVRFVNRRAEASGILEPQTISISPARLTVLSVAGEGKIKWRFIKDLRKTNKNIFFQLYNFTGYIVPLYAFNKQEDAEAFFEEAKGYWRSAH